MSEHDEKLWNQHQTSVKDFADTYIQKYVRDFVSDFAATFTFLLTEDLTKQMQQVFAPAFSESFAAEYAKHYAGASVPDNLKRMMREYMKYEDEGELLAAVCAIENLMRNKGMKQEEAMDAIGIPVDKRLVYEAAMRHVDRRKRERPPVEEDELLEDFGAFAIDMPAPDDTGAIVTYVSPVEQTFVGSDDEMSRTIRQITGLVRDGGMSIDEAMDAIGVPEEERQGYLFVMDWTEEE